MVLGYPLLRPFGRSSTDDVPDIFDIDIVVDIKRDQEVERFLLQEDNRPLLYTAHELSGEVLAAIPEQDCESPQALRDYFQNASYAADPTVKCPRSCRRHKFKQALEYAIKNRRWLIRSFAKAAGLCAGITCLINMSPMILRDIFNRKQHAEILLNVITTCGPLVWAALKQGGMFALRLYLRNMIGPTVANSVVGTIAIEALVALFGYLMDPNYKISVVLERMGGMRAIACIAVVFSLPILAVGFRFVVDKLSKVRLPKLIESMVDFVALVFDFVSAKFGAGALLTGAVLVFAGQAGNAVMIASLLGATAATGTPIAALTGAAAQRATLAWLGGGPLAAGGGGMAGGAFLLSTLTFVGNAMTGIGTIILMYKFFRWLTKPNNLDDVTKDQFGENPGPDREERNNFWSDLEFTFLLHFTSTLLLLIVSNYKYTTTAILGAVVYVIYHYYLAVLLILLNLAVILWFFLRK